MIKTKDDLSALNKYVHGIYIINFREVLQLFQILTFLCSNHTACLPEFPLSLKLTVKRYTVGMESLALFTCKVSKLDLRVTWYRGDERLQPSNKYEIVDEGCMHKLIVHDLCSLDYADYIVVIGSRRMTGFMLREGGFLPLHVSSFKVQLHFLFIVLLWIYI